VGKCLEAGKVRCWAGNSLEAAGSAGSGDGRLYIGSHGVSCRTGNFLVAASSGDGRVNVWKLRGQVIGRVIVW
jgi:hypothetical protein